MNKQPDTRHDTLFPRLAQALRATIGDYIHLRSDGETAGLSLLKAYILAGPQYWLGLGMLLLGVLATAYLTLSRATLPSVTAEVFEGQWMTLPVAGLWAALAVLAIGWAYLLRGAASYGLGAYVLAVVYILYFGLTPAILHHREWWFALVPAWLAIQGGWLASASPSRRWRWLWLLGLGLATGIYTFNALGLSRLLPTVGLAGRLGLGLVWFGLLANPLSLRARRFRPALAFGVTLALFSALYLLANALGPAQDLLGLAFISLHDLLGLVGLFWFWMGLDLFNGAQDLATWITNATQRLFSQRLLRALIVIFWALRLLLDYIAMRTPPLWLLRALEALPGGLALLQRLWALPWSPATLDALYYDLYVMLTVAALSLVLWARRALTHARLMALFGASLLALLALLGGHALFYAVAAPQEETAQSFWPLLIYVTGMVWEVIKSGSGLVTAGRARKPLFLGFVLVLVGIAMIELAGDYRQFQVELALNTFYGALYLGLPYLLYRYVYARQRQPQLSTRNLLLLFGVGMLTAMPAVWFEAWYAAPWLWCLALLTIVWRAGRWETPADGLAYALTLGLGFVTFYTQPVLIPVPAHIPQLAELMYAQAAYLEHTLYPWQTLWWFVLAAYVLAAAALGLAAWRAHRARGWKSWAWLLAGCLAAVLLVSALRAISLSA